jgi:hypothetical protein
MGLPLGAALLLGATLAPTDPVLAGAVGLGPPGEEDLESDARFNLTIEASANDALAAPFLLAGSSSSSRAAPRGCPSGRWATSSTRRSSPSPPALPAAMAWRRWPSACAGATCCTASSTGS